VDRGDWDMNGFNPAAMNPDMMKAAQDMMSKMSPDDMQNMMKMQQQMMSNPAMMQQAQQMMSNPAMMEQAASQMKNMSADDVRNNMKQAEKALPVMAAATPQTAVAKLKASAMAVPAQVVEAVEQAEANKAAGNASFKCAEYECAASKYSSAIDLIEPHLKCLTGNDKKAVVEVKEACQLNLANCHLKLKDWAAAKMVCTTVLSRGENRKARFRRGDAHRALGNLEEARDDLAAAVKMDPSDNVVVGKLKDVEKALGIEESDSCIEEVDTSAATSSKAPAAAPSVPSRIPDPAQMESMLDQVSPEQMAQQAQMMENLSPEQLKAMGVPEGVDREQLKMAANMMKGMDKETMKNMTKMAAQMAPQMQAMNAGGGGGSSSGDSAEAVAHRGASSAIAGMGSLAGMDPSNLSMDQGMDMMKNMSPEMMQSGMEMMKNMDPAMMKNMSKMMGREIDEGQLEQMQSMMSNMKPEDMQKWAGRAQKVAAAASMPIATYKKVKEYASFVGNMGFVAIFGAVLGIMMVGHVASLF